MRHYWYDAEADIMYVACLQSYELILIIILSVMCWELCKWLWRLK
jgi:hypothetical protein